MGTSLFQVNLPTPLPELRRLLRHPLLRLRHARVPNILADLHRAELGPAHRAEVGHLGALGGQGLVVEGARGHRIERQVELILPPKLKARPAQRVVPLPCARVALGQVGGAALPRSAPLLRIGTDRNVERA